MRFGASSSPFDARRWQTGNCLPSTFTEVPMLRSIIDRLAKILEGEHPLPPPPPMPTRVEYDPNEYVAAQQKAPRCYACAKPKPQGQVLCEACIAARARWAS